MATDTEGGRLGFHSIDEELDAEREDDGVLLAVVLHPDTERSVLHVVDARTMEALATAPLPHALPLDFHGQFLAGVQ